MHRPLLALSAVLFAGACATVSPTLSYDEAIAAGSTPVPSTAERIGDDGFTMSATDGKTVAYLGPGGRKVVAVEGREPAELTWRLTDDGTFCEDYYSRDGQEVCGEETRTVVAPDGVHTDYIDGRAQDWTYTIERGNPRGL